MTRYDAVVVGSGFGGAIVSARLAEAGRSVCLLEKGRRWAPREFPRTFSQAAGAVWDGQTSLGFLEYRVFAHADVIQGVGVGGGSLHYFNVQLRAPQVIFERPGWPSAVTRASLDPYYDRVEAITTPAPLTPPEGDTMPRRTTAFLEAARRAGFDANLVPIAIHTGADRLHPVSGLAQDTCTYASDCLLGCRARAKNSLDVTYIPLGERHGLEVRPLSEVERIEPLAGGGYAVSGRQREEGRPESSERFRVEAGIVVLAAGTLGTTELLLRARDRDRTLPNLPSAVGRRFSANGDMLFAGTADAPVVVDSSHGPSITAGAFVQPPSSRNIILIEDLGYPPALTSLFDGTIPVASRVRSLAHAGVGYARAAMKGRAFPAKSLFGGSFVPHFLPYLGMGTDNADGHMRIDAAGRLRLSWDPRGSGGMYREMEDAMVKLSEGASGHYVRSMPWRRPLRRVLTAHPLGGCVMSDSPGAGVANDRGEVWGHPGLFVADGSIVPGPLAVNPSLTIGALAERVAQWMIHGRDAF